MKIDLVMDKFGMGKIRNVDLGDLEKNGSSKYFDFLIFLLFIISNYMEYKQKCWTILVNLRPC